MGGSARTKIDRDTLEAVNRASARAAEYLRAHLLGGTAVDAAVVDIAAWYKAPSLFLACGDLPAAHRYLDHVKAVFMSTDGDFVTRPGMKSENAAFQEYWAYPNGWLVMAAQRLGRFDVAQSGARYLARFRSAALDGFLTHDPQAADVPVADVLTNAHLGLTALYLGDVASALSAARMLRRCADRQPDMASAFYLRLDADGQPLTDFPADAALFHCVSATQPQQAYFMIGYPLAFLGKLYQATGDEAWLIVAGRYLAFALSCGDAIRRCHFSHKVAWGAAVLAGLTADEAAAELALAIARYLLETQDPSGAWLPAEPPIVSYDQTAEVALWLREITAELR